MIENDDGVKTNFLKMFPDKVSKSWRQWFSTYSICRRPTTIDKN